MNYESMSFYETRGRSRILVEIRTLVAWLKSTLLMKIKCFYTHIYMKTDCLQINKMQHSLGKENAWEADGVGERLALIKSLIYGK